MSQDPLISVIMSTYNEEFEWVTESVNSILNQIYRNFEFIIVIDNPERKDIIDYIKSCKRTDGRIILIINKTNLGLIKSLNKAISVSKGRYIARMDADDISHLDRLEKQLRYIEEKNLDLIGSNINLFRGQREIFFTTNKLLTHKYLKKMLLRGTIGIVHPTFFGKKEVFDSLGGYSYSPHTEDKEFLARVFVSGYKVGNIADVLLDSRYTDSSVTKKNAIIIDLMGRYITRVFIEFEKTGKYNFDKTFYDRLQISENQIEKYSKVQILLGTIRNNINKKKYLNFFCSFTKAFIIAPSYVMSSIKINLFLKIYKIIEKHKLSI